MTSIKRPNARSGSDRCEKCGSNNWQGIEFAYAQSVRKSESGFVTHSLFSQSISPPERRSTFASPLFSGFAFGNLTLVTLPLLQCDEQNCITSLLRMFDADIYVPALIVSCIVFAIQAVNASTYNSTKWASDYLNWSEQRVCRRCGRISLAPELGDE